MDLYQGSYWEDEDGDRIWIRNMSPRHAHNACRWLENHASKIAEADSWAMYGVLGRVSGDAASDCLEAAFAEDEATKIHPIAWIKSTPVWQALDQQSRAEVTIENFFR